MNRARHILCLEVVCMLLGQLVWAGDEAALRLVPYPKEVVMQAGVCALDRQMVLTVPAGTKAIIGRLLCAELGREKLPLPALHESGRDARWLRLSAWVDESAPDFKFREKAGPEYYALDVRPNGITCGSPGEQGLIHAAQTICQLIRANRQGNGIPCLSIRDWPALQYRGFQNDLTRGPSATLPTLKAQIDLSSFFKMNLFSYYMEHQFAFKKYPMIGPADGSFTPAELKALVEYAKSLQIDIMGNQQSFGHLGTILKRPEFANIRENDWAISPAREESYTFLNDLYSEVCPLLPFPMFNVCCDEVGDLKGPSKELVDKIGAGGVYVRHVRRIHDILKEKHNKRMMMWGDIILHHPDKLADLPKDTVMLTWGYDAGTNFENKIIPFAKAGYEFFICPGVSSWNRILPDFSCATTNIRYFVRDGVKHGAIGMLNTDWKDDCESLNAPTWHGAAWGAECAWNASTTTPEDFNRRIGAVLFGEKGDHFGQAIELLSQAFSVRGMNGMMNWRFWENDFASRADQAEMRSSAEELLKVVRPALKQLEACRIDAKVNADLLDLVIFGARRMELLGLRILDGLEVIQSYQQVYEGGPKNALPALEKIKALVRKNRDAHDVLGKQFVELWNREVKPFALDRVTKRYDEMRKRHDDLLSRLDEAGTRVAEGKPLPHPGKIGLGAIGSERRVWADQEVDQPLQPTTPWADTTASHRLGLVVRAGDVERRELPVEIDLVLPAELKSKPVRAFCVIKNEATAVEVPVQLDELEKSTRTRLTLLIPGPIPAQSQAAVHVYLGLAGKPVLLPQAVSTSDAADGMKWLENDRVRLLLGPEGAHIYRWEVKALENRDLTQPGEKGWEGFSDLGGQRRKALNVLKCMAAGPALVRYRCADPSGLVKQVSLYAGASWMDVVLSESATYWDFDNSRNFAADGPTPGQYLFSDGRKGVVGRSRIAAQQVHADQVVWGVKFNEQKLALGMVTPDTRAWYTVAPGDGVGGLGVHGKDICHVITFAGQLQAEPAATMKRLQQTLTFKTPPSLVLHAVEVRK